MSEDPLDWTRAFPNFTTKFWSTDSDTLQEEYTVPTTSQIVLQWSSVRKFFSVLYTEKSNWTLIKKT